MDGKCEKYKKIDFDSLDSKNMNYIEAKAEYEKEQQLTQERVNGLNRKMYQEFMSVNKMAEMYGLNQPTVESNDKQTKDEPKCCPMMKPKESVIEKNKHKILYSILLVVVILLATGITPQGSIAELIQTQWVETIVDVFKVILIAIALYIGYKGLIKDEK